MNKTFYDYITRQIAAIRDMLFSLREATIRYDNAAELESVLFDAINALTEFEIILERINENKENEKWK